MARPKKVQENEALQSAAESGAELGAGESTTNEAAAQFTDEQGIELPTTNEAPKPVTLQGKSVPMSASGKAFHRNKITGRIITGLIDHKLAVETAKNFPNIEVVNP